MREDVKTSDVKTEEYAQTREREAEEIDELTEYWEKADGSKLNQLLIAKLNALLEKNSLADLKAAIDRANSGTNSSQFGFSLDYVQLKLSEIKKAKKTKGGVGDEFLGY